MLGNYLSTFRTEAKILPLPVIAIIATLLATTAGIMVGFLSTQYLTIMIVLLLGLPLLPLALNPSSQQTAIVLLLSFIPLIGIVKAFSGSRFAPLTFDIGIALISILHFTNRLLKKQSIIDGIDLAVYLFIGVALLQMFNPNIPSLQASIEGFRKFAFMIVGFYVGKHVISNSHIRRFQWMLIGTSILVALYGIKQYYYLSPIEERMIDLSTSSRVTYLMDGYLRPFSTLAGPFHLGLYLIVTMLLLGRYSISNFSNIRLQIIFLIAIGIELTALIMTRTKGNWAGLFAGFIILVLIGKNQLLKKIFVVLLLLLLAMGTIVLFLSFLPDAAQESIRKATSAISNPLEAPTFIFRMQLWEDFLLPALNSNPIWGYGTGSAGEGLSNLYEGTSSLFFNSHNLYLKVLLELGLFGFILFAYVIGSTLYRSIKLLMTARNLSSEKLITLQWSVAVIGAFLISGTVIPVLDAYPTNLYFWLLVGFIHRKDWSN